MQEMERKWGSVTHWMPLPEPPKDMLTGGNDRDN